MKPWLLAIGLGLFFLPCGYVDTEHLSQLLNATKEG
jgi:hypothetical protein